jgi:hypothetical protein
MHALRPRGIIVDDHHNVYALSADGDLFFASEFNAPTPLRPGSALLVAPSLAKYERIAFSSTDGAHAFGVYEHGFFGIDAVGDLYVNRLAHRHKDTKPSIVASMKVGEGWSSMTHVTADGNTIFAADATGSLRWYKLGAPSPATWHVNSGSVIGTGWGVEHLAAGRDGTLYAADRAGNIRWYKYTGKAGEWSWAPESGRIIGTGFHGLPSLLAGRDGAIYAVGNDGSIRLHYDPILDRRKLLSAADGVVIATGWHRVPNAPRRNISLTQSALSCRIARISALQFPFIRSGFEEVGYLPSELDLMATTLGRYADEVCSGRWDGPAGEDLKNIEDAVVRRTAQRWSIAEEAARTAIIGHISSFGATLGQTCSVSGKELLVASEQEFDLAIKSIALGACKDSRPSTSPPRGVAWNDRVKKIDSCMAEFRERLRPKCDPRMDAPPSTSTGSASERSWVLTSKKTDANGNIVETFTATAPDGSRVVAIVATAGAGQGLGSAHDGKVYYTEVQFHDDKSGTTKIEITLDVPSQKERAYSAQIAFWATTGLIGARIPNPYVAAVIAVVAGAAVAESTFERSKWTSLPKKQCVAFDESGVLTYSPMTHAGGGKPDSFTAFEYCRCKAQEQMPASSAADCQGCVKLPSRCLSEDDKKRMACLADPFGPDDGLRKECFDLLRKDDPGANAAALMKACQVVKCTGDLVATPVYQGDQLSCPCLKQTVPTGGDSAPRVCGAISCPDTAPCSCIGGQCGCGLKELPPVSEPSFPCVGSGCPPGPDPGPRH